MNVPYTELFVATSKITPIINALQSIGATSYLVGGSVRDLILKKPIKDLDIEVHGINFEQLQETLRTFGPVILCGQSFGVLKLTNHQIDWSLPRTDSAGRKPLVAINPHLGIEKALQRRDFTINAMAINLNLISTHASSCKDNSSCLHAVEIIDPYNGLHDLTHGILRAVDDQLFIEDPLRLFRAMQFIGRFELTADKSLNNLCKTMLLSDPESNKTLARERIIEELKKLFTQAAQPSRGIRWIIAIEKFNSLFPDLPHFLTNPHTPSEECNNALKLLDIAASKTTKNQYQFAFMLSAFLFNTIHTKTFSQTYTVIKKTLHSLANDQHLIKTVATLLFYTPQALTATQAPQPTIACKKLAHLIAPTLTLETLGKFLYITTDTTTHQIFINYAQQAGVYTQEEKAILSGADLLNSIQPGPLLGAILEKVYLYQLEQNITDPIKLHEYALSLITPPPRLGA